MTAAIITTFPSVDAASGGGLKTFCHVTLPQPHPKSLQHLITAHSKGWLDWFGLVWVEWHFVNCKVTLLIASLNTSVGHLLARVAQGLNLWRRDKHWGGVSSKEEAAIKTVVYLPFPKWNHFNLLPDWTINQLLKFPWEVIVRWLGVDSF